MICVPFSYNKKILGVLTVVSNQANFFAEREIEILKLLSNALSSKMYQIQEAVELANLNQKLTEQIAISRNRLEARTKFLANISHEIRTPLTGIIGTIDLLKDTTLTAEQKTYLEALDSSADTLISLINDILDFSKLEAGQVHLEQITISLKDIVGSAINNMIFRAKKKQLALNLTYDEKIPPYLIGDPIRIQEILLNLISNAIKFTSKGKVDVILKLHSLSKEYAVIKFIVSDTGIGIPKEAQKTIFKPFEQADKSTTRKYGGTGLGLSITKNLVEMMNGKIFLKSKVEEGTTFWFKLKLPITTPKEIENTNSHSISHCSLNVLVAEDNMINAMITQQMLEKLGHTSVWVENGVEALKAISKTEFDLILMDCYMPEMDGFEATRRIRSLPNKKVAEVPIFALTASVLTPEDKEWKEAGMNGFLSKPIRLQTLREAISSIITSYNNS